MKIHNAHPEPIGTDKPADPAGGDGSPSVPDRYSRAGAEPVKRVTTLAGKPVEIKQAAPSADETTGAHRGEQPDDDEQASAVSAQPTDEAEQQEHDQRKRQQRLRRKVLALCEPLLLSNHEVLALPGYPDNERIEMARRRRDLWILLCCVLVVVFVLGLMSFANAILAGIASGALASALSFAIPQVRGLFIHAPSYGELLAERRALELRALNHVSTLEGKEGLARHFPGLVDYNGALRNRSYQKLMQLSARRTLLRALRTPGAIRLYEQMLYEAETAYQRLREAYLAEERRLLDELPPAQPSAAPNSDRPETEQN